ncbi:MAG: hypothetical protein FD171_115 [Actinobacteria bacterium]|nr:MAG: hypothetical protein FD171_115 [Actinomycetota bacterium]
MKSRSTILSVYGPVLLAALLIMTAAPACAMPDCGFGANSGPVAACGETVQFKSACDMPGGAGPTRSTAPCHEGSCSDTVMSYGAADATVATGVDVPAVATIAQAPRVPALVSIRIASAPRGLTEPHPPDPLGVRLRV